MGAGEPSLSSLQPLSIPSSGWLWVEILGLLFFMVFCTFVISILILFCQSTISLLLIIHLKFWAWLSTINTSKNSRRDLYHSRIFGPCRKNVPDSVKLGDSFDYFPLLEITRSLSRNKVRLWLNPHKRALVTLLRVTTLVLKSINVSFGSKNVMK